MQERDLKVGDRVVTEFGAGVVAGFEQFDVKGASAPLSQAPTGGRIAIQLDPGHTWAFKHQLAYFREKELVTDA